MYSMNNSKKSFKIFIFGIISQVVTLLLGIIIPRLVIVSYGSEVNGLLSSIRQIFVYVALLEAGIGTAALQAMYAPIASNDHARASQIMSATDRYFKRTGVLYGIVVIALAFLYPVVIKVELSYWTVVAIILLQGTSGVIKYFFQGKLTILLRVDGKSYITTNATTIVNVATHAVQIILLLSGFNVIAVQSVYFIINLVQMVYLTWYVQKNYSWLDLRAEPDYASLKQSKYVIVHQVSGLIFNNTDVILLTAFCDLKVVSVYSLYSMIFSCVANVIDTICSSVEFILGQAFNSDKKRFLQLQEVYETYYLGVSFAFFTITLLLFPSFIQLYTSGIKDINYVDPWLPYLFTTLYVLMYARRTSSQIINFAGHFQQTQWRSILESAINLSVSVFLVAQVGIYGVLIGTIVALLYRTNDIIIYTNRKILNRFPWKTYRRWGINLAVMVFLVCWLKRYLSGMENYLMWVLNALWVSIVCLVAFFVIDSLFDRSSFYFVVGRIKRFIVSRRKLRE